MRVLHIIGGLGSGGAQKLVEDSVPVMNQLENIEVEVLLLNDSSNVFDKKLKENKIKISVVPLRKPRSPINIFFIRNHIVRGNYDIVHVHLFPTNYWASIASKLIIKNKPKFITTEHSTHNRRRDRWYFRNIDRLVYSNYDKVFSISEQTQNNLLNWLGVKGEKSNKFIVIENGIDVSRFVNAIPYKKNEVVNGLRETDILLCMGGRFSIQKDQATIIKAMKNLPSHIHLLLIGEGELKFECEQLAKKLGVSDRVHFLGFRYDVDRIFKSVDIVVLSSHWEGFGLAAVEGMAAGKPVIASAVQGLREVVEGAGRLFPRGNSSALSEIVKSLINNKDEYTKIKQASRDKADLFHIDKMVKEYVKEYNSLRIN